MRTINLLTVIGLLLLSSVFNEVNAQEKGYYYFAYASLDKYSEHIYITPILFIPDRNCNLEDPRSNAGIANQFREYMESEYRGILYKNEAEIFNNIIFSKAKAQESRRLIMKYAKKITKINDFEYLCD